MNLLELQRRLTSCHTHFHRGTTTALPEGERLLNLEPDQEGNYTLTAGDLVRLIDPKDSLMAVVLNKFLDDPEACAHIAHQLTLKSDYQHPVLPGLKLFSIPSLYSLKTPKDWDDYFAFGRDGLNILTDLSKPYPNPLNHLFSTLGPVWPGGIDQERLKEGGRPLAPFSARVWHKGPGCIPHIDRLSFDTDQSPKALEHAGQLSYNIIVSSPPGGETIFYNRLFIHMKDYAASQPVYERNESDIPECLRFPAPLGSLLMLSSQVLHAVAPLEKEARVTISGFLSLPRDPSHSIGVWG